MRRLLPALLLVAAACGDTGTTTTSSPPATDPEPTTTVTTAAPTTTAPPSSTTTSTVPPTAEGEPPAGAAPDFKITQVVFGEAGFIQITNIGNGVGDPGGHWLCQRPVYFELPSIELAPGQSVWVAADRNDLQFVGNVAGVVNAGGRMGSLAVASGEIALYRSNDFGSPDAIVDYVEWGTAGHGRSSVAVAAGMWPSGGFVETPEGTIAIAAAVPNANDPAEWAPDIGV